MFSIQTRDDCNVIFGSEKLPYVVHRSERQYLSDVCLRGLCAAWEADRGLVLDTTKESKEESDEESEKSEQETEDKEDQEDKKKGEHQETKDALQYLIGKLIIDIHMLSMCVLLYQAG